MDYPISINVLKKKNKLNLFLKNPNMEDQILQYENTLFAEGRHYVPVLYLCSQKFPDIEENKIFNLVTNLKNDIDRVYLESIRAMGKGVGKGNWSTLKSE